MISAFKVFVLLTCCLVISMAASNGLQVKGGRRQLSEEELKEAEKQLQVSLTKLAAGEGPNYKISKVHSGTRQVVSGNITRLYVELIDDKSATKNCDVSIWSQPWLPQGIEVTFECPGEEKVVKNHDA